MLVLTFSGPIFYYFYANCDVFRTCLRLFVGQFGCFPDLFSTIFMLVLTFSGPIFDYFFQLGHFLDLFLNVFRLYFDVFRVHFQLFLG